MINWILPNFIRTASGRRPGVLTFLGTSLALALLPAAPALAHGGTHPEGAEGFSAWALSWDILLPTLLVAVVYAAGLRRRGPGNSALALWRHAAFFAGLASVFLALQSPLDPLAERLFSLHQLQHLLLRMLGPMLITLSWPAAVLIAGLPGPLRRQALAPGLASGPLRALFGLLAQPLVATALFIAALYLWEVPDWHNAALLDDLLHYAMHVTMLAAGLLFWWRVFDRRPPPQGARYGMRVLMLGLVILSNIALGAYTTLKGGAIYDAYDVAGRIFGATPLGDEQLGGVVIWIPSSMMCLIAVLVVLHFWGRHETRNEEKHQAWSAANPGASRRPTTAAEMIARQRPKNRALALGFTAFVFLVFAAAFGIGLLNHARNLAAGHPPAEEKLIQHAAPATTPPKPR